MTKNRTLHFVRAAAMTALLFAARPVAAITPAELSQRMQRGENISLIDVRGADAFARGTLPGAMRMSAAEAVEKPLGGLVIFFDDGTGPNLARAAVERMSDAGKSADFLSGGYAAWLESHGATTEAPGMYPLFDRYVSYQELVGEMTGDAGDIVVIDLREAEQNADGAKRRATTAEASLDLGAELPGFTISKGLPGRSPVKRTASGANAPRPLYVLIDAGDGKAEETARQLRESGNYRVAILAGGEEIIRRRGEAGSIRRGPGTGLVEPSAYPPHVQSILKQGEETP